MKKMDFVLSQTTASALEGALKRLAETAQSNLDEEYIVIAPETKTLFVERTLLKYTSSHAFTNIYIYSFSRLLKKLQIKPIFPLSKEAGVMIIRNLIMELAADLVCYKKTAMTVGFAENIYETIQQLKSSSISPIELSESAKKCSPALRIKLEDIALIYDAYENYIGEELSDPADKLIMLEKQLEISDRIKNSNMYIVGFDSLTTEMVNVIKSALKNAKSLTVSASFMHPSLKNAHISDNEVYERLKKVADGLNIKYDPILADKKLDGDFKLLYRNLYCYPVSKAKTNGSVRLMGCQSTYEESLKVASLIKEDILKGKYRYKDICIFLADENAKHQVESALEDYDIPYFSASPYEFESHPLFDFIKNLFQCIRKNYENEDVLNFSKNILLGLDDNKLNDFENYVLKFGINHLKFLKPFTIQDELLLNAEEIRNNVMGVISSFSGVYGENLTVSELVDEIFAFFEEFNMENKLKTLEKTQKDHKDERSAMATVQSFEKAKTVLLMLKQFLGSRKLKLDELYTLLISGLEASDISLLPLGIDNVLVVNSADGLMDVKCLYVVGAADGKFPKREQDLGLIQDADISAIEGISEKKIEPTIRSINRRERFKTFELLLLPTDKLTISYSEKSEGNEEEKMSSLMLSIADIFLNGDGSDFEIEKINTPFNEQDGESLALSLGSKNVATNYLAENISEYREGQNYQTSEENIHSLYKALEDNFTLQEKDSFSKINLEKTEGKIEDADKLFFKKGTTSISELESYFSCPFKHFVTYGLRLKERKEASLRALDIGDILHSLAEQFVRHYNKTQNFDIDKLSVNILNKILKENKYSEDENVTLINILKEESKRLCQNLYSQLQSSSFKPTGLEKWFGGGELKGIKLRENPDISIVGKIDRLDETDDYYRIIDYKTGKISTTDEDIYYGRKLQLAIYLSAVGEIRKKPAAVLYFPVHNEFKDGEEEAKDAYRMQGFLLDDIETARKMDTTLNLDEPKSHSIPVRLKTSKDHIKKNIMEFYASKNLLSPNELESMREYAIAISKKAVDEILSGYFKATPLKKGESLPCDYCAFKNVCSIASEEYKSIRLVNKETADGFYEGGATWEK